MISRLPEEKPCKAKGKEMLRVYGKGCTTTHPVSGCKTASAWVRGGHFGGRQPLNGHVKLQWYSPCKEQIY